MKRKIAATVLAVAFVLTGCSNAPVESESYPAPLVTSSIPQQSTNEELYLNTVKNNVSSSLAREPERDMLELGRTVCASIEQQGAEAVINLASENTHIMDAEDFGVVFAASVVHLCPEHRQEVQEFLADVDSRTML